jgi:hypothetical protein
MLTLRSIIEKQKNMLDRQVLKDQQGVPMGVFIPMQSWNNIIFQYPDIEALDTDLPQWEKDFIDKRLDMAQSNPKRLKPVEMLLKTL